MLAGRLYKMISSRLLLGVLVASVVCFSLGATDPTEHFNKLGNKLMCTCGCAQSLLLCDHEGCPSRGQEMDDLRSGINSGQSDEAILQGFVGRYGTVVLAAPTTHGFDLLAWIMPFAVALVALLGTIFLVRHWAAQQPKLADHASLSPAQARAEDEMRERIRRETGTDGGV
ncbi:cytochrome c-type biogenesis protein [Acidicapsa ligni]|uniref:cytochrome c-type biogenesis protein n=1 Tax=Acidicapsa ligni TaxID=542300 RepID=UPI0021DFCC6B|nr:cytochrome c-type biogenesis protein CcmH [Acidicapsa ligni]